MKAGKYYIGDLCYVMHDEWEEVCDLSIDGNQVMDGEFTMKNGTRFALYRTAYGDGTYTDEAGNSYPVDAGCIGCVLVDDIDLSNESNDLTGGNVHTFDSDFFTGSENGVIRFGNVWINTEYEECENDDNW